MHTDLRLTGRRTALLPSLIALLLSAAAAPALAQPAAPAAASAPAQPTLRPEVARPLLAAQEALKAADKATGAKDALARVAEAEAVPGLNPYEAYMALRIKAVAAFAAGDLALSLASFDQVLGSTQLPAPERLGLTEVAAKLAVQLKDDPRALRLLPAYRELGGKDGVLRLRLATLLLDRNDHAGALREARQLAQDEEAAGRVPQDIVYKVMAVSHNKLGDQAGYLATLEKLTQHYPTPEYWSELIGRTVRKSGFADDRLRLDVYRLQRAVGLPLEADELADMAQRAQLAGLPAEAQRLLDEGFASGLLGKGPGAAAQQKLREQATRAAAADQKQLAEGEASARSAKDGNLAASLGLAVAGSGAHERALALMELGQAKGGLRRPDDALLQLGQVQARLGRTEDALRSFAAVKGGDGTADLARLWSLHLRGGAAAKK